MCGGRIHIWDHLILMQLWLKKNKYNVLYHRCKSSPLSYRSRLAVFNSITIQFISLFSNILFHISYSAYMLFIIGNNPQWAMSILIIYSTIPTRKSIWILVLFHFLALAGKPTWKITPLERWAVGMVMIMSDNAANKVISCWLLSQHTVLCSILSKTQRVECTYISYFAMCFANLHVWLSCTWVYSHYAAICQIIMCNVCVCLQ